MDIQQRRIASQKISRTDWNRQSESVKLKTYWCRVVFNQWKKWNYAVHCHSFFELHMSIKGEGTFDVEGRELVITPGTFLLVSAGKLHQTKKVSQDFEQFVWGFSVEDKVLESALLTACNSCGVHRAPDRMPEAVSIMLENAGGEHYGGYQIVKSQMDYIFALMLRQLTGIKNEQFTAPLKTGFRSEMICKFMEDNLAVELNAEDVAANFGICVRQLYRICQSENGMSFQELKTQVRMERIRKLLTTTEMSLDEIANCTGFADRYSLGKFFKKWEGLSPASFKKSYTK